MESQVTLPAAPTSSPSVLMAGAIWVISYFLARYIMDTYEPPPPHWDIAVASIPLLVFFWLVWAVQRRLRRADELQRRIHLEALAMAFLTVMLTVMGIGLLEGTPRGNAPLPWRDLWLALPVLYGVCFVVANRHYR